MTESVPRLTGTNLVPELEKEEEKLALINKRIRLFGYTFVLALVSLGLSYYAVSMASLDGELEYYKMREGITALTLERRAQDPTIDWLTYHNEEYGFEFKYPGDWSAGNLNDNSNLDYSKTTLMIWAGKTSSEPCGGLGCPPEPGDMEDLTKGYTLEGAPPISPWFKMLRVKNDVWVSVQMTDWTKICTDQAECEQYIKRVDIESRTEITDGEYNTYNDFIKILSTFRFIDSQ